MRTFFDLDSTTGQLSTKSGQTYDFESKRSYTVTVAVTDGTATDTVTVTIALTDVDEAPGTPVAPTFGDLDRDDAGGELAAAGEHGSGDHGLRRAVPGGRGAVVYEP